MSEEEYPDLKDEKDMIDSQMKQNMNSLEIQENEELFSGKEQPNMINTEKEYNDIVGQTVDDTTYIKNLNQNIPEINNNMVNIEQATTNTYATANSQVNQTPIILKNENRDLNEYVFGEEEDKYIAIIEELENELLIEQHITKSLKKDISFNEEVNKLKSELNSKNNKLEKLKSINKKQENTLLEFKNKLKKEIKIRKLRIQQHKQ